jgi:hypothetical protein
MILKHISLVKIPKALQKLITGLEYIHAGVTADMASKIKLFFKAIYRGLEAYGTARAARQLEQYKMLRTWI